ncbi:MAG: hypothetical protein ISP69_02165 [Crocinitomicaceae bacterium]|nr:hypothetical protein [Crocinitomicaceae bacterium]
MKNLLFLLVFPFFSIGQDSYIEINAGLANLDDSDFSFFPGGSVLWGKIFEKKGSNFLIDMQVGLALPSVVTAKIGIGSFLNKEKKSAISAGIRPWPLHLYTQVNFNEGKRGQWIVSLEAGSTLLEEGGVDGGIGGYDFDELAMSSRFILNFGYRWNIGKK